VAAVTCHVCGGARWLPIPDPVAGRSITTAGRLLSAPLGKGQCAACGVVQRIHTAFVGDSDYYDAHYAGYYLRSGARVFDAPRYAAMMEWLRAEVADLDPKTILDVGCGAGWAMRALQKHFPGSTIEGVEPSTANADLARQAGFTVYGTRIGDAVGPRKAYALVYASNVLQHVLSPTKFLTALREHVADHGLVVLICPDASRASNEMLWADHNFSFAPEHLGRLATATGFHVTSWRPNPDHESLLDKQLVVLSKDPRPRGPVREETRTRLDVERLYAARCAYVEGWKATDAHLLRETAACARVFNFGASSWTWLLAAYCPGYWARVESCVVDGFEGVCLDKDVRATASLTLGPGDGMVLGVNPVTQGAFERRLGGRAFKTVRWNHYVRS
jgi:SAM-dependent methyltransferase